MRQGILIAAVVAAAGVAALVLMPSAPVVPEPEDEPVKGGKPQDLFFVGWPGEPETDALLAELDAMLQAAGVRPDLFSAREVTIWSKGTLKNGQRPSAFAPREYWPGMVRTIVQVAQPLRLAYGLPLRASGYRDPQYNAAVGGAPKSRHMWMDALDLHPIKATRADKERLAHLAANLWREHPGIPMGLGIYPAKGGKYGYSSHVHVDTGGRRTWGMAKQYIEAGGAAVA
jgi:hypothetical protein